VTPKGLVAQLAKKEATRLYEPKYLEHGHGWSGWVPLEANFVRFKVSRAHTDKTVKVRCRPRYTYMGFLASGPGIPVPESWVLAQKGEGWVKTLGMCKTSLWLGRQVPIQPGAAAPSSVESRDTVPPMIATAVTGITGSRDSAHASDSAGSRLSASSSQELSVPDIRYPQGDRDFCAFFGLASALHHSGMLAQAKVLVDIAQASLVAHYSRWQLVARSFSS